MSVLVAKIQMGMVIQMDAIEKAKKAGFSNRLFWKFCFSFVLDILTKTIN